jgi:hypothetical protein
MKSHPCGATICLDAVFEHRSGMGAAINRKCAIGWKSRKRRLIIYLLFVCRCNLFVREKVKQMPAASAWFSDYYLHYRTASPSQKQLGGGGLLP